MPMRAVRQLRRIGILSLAILLLAASLRAQVSTALVQGEVTDGTKAVLPGVTVTARDQETGLSRTVVTDERGWYRISALKPGRYELTLELAGFAATKKSAVTLTIGQEATIHVQMSLVAVQESGNVTGDAPLSEPSQATLGSTSPAKKRA